MANRRPQNGGGRRMDFGRNDRKNFGRSGVSPWQGGGPGASLPNLLPLGGGSTEATLALASNIINLLQPRQNPVPSLLDMPIRRDFGPVLDRFDRGYPPNRMGNQGNFRRSGNYNRPNERNYNNRRPFRPNDGQKQQYKNSPKKDADSKAKPVKESSDAEAKGDAADTSEVKDETANSQEAKPDAKKDAPKTRYDDIDPQLLKCHICNKSMWDGRSFENHLNGRAHSIMMQKTAESYALTADTMRQEIKIREMKRHRKSGEQLARDFYCAMCDMYAADGALHRTTIGHRKLKKYLHPQCTQCHKEMPTRIELDEHRLTADHLRNMQDKQDVGGKPKPEVMVISTLTMERSYVRDDLRRRQDSRRDTRQDKDDDKQEQEAETEVKQEPTEEAAQDGGQQEIKNGDRSDTVLDYQEGDDMAAVTQDMFPAYNTERGVGKSFLSEFRCYQCNLCRKLLDSQETAEVHLRTWRHHQLFIKHLQDKCPELQPKTEPTEEATSGNNKRPLNAEESGNWKRRKTSPERDEQDHEDPDTNGHDDATKDAEDTSKEQETVSEEWENIVDEILDDEVQPDAALNEEQPPEQELLQEETPQEQPEPEPVPEAKPEPEPQPQPQQQQQPQQPQPKAWTPRGRGRGRGRRRY